MNVKKIAPVAAAVACMFSSQVAAQASGVYDVLTVGSGWDPFNWNGYAGSDGGPFLEGACSIVVYDCPEVGFLFALTANSDFNITDAFYPGDQFDVTITNLLAGTSVDEGPTSSFIYTGLDAVTDFDAAYADPSFSHGSYALGPGLYFVTGDVSYTTYGYGQGAVELSVPEPAGWAMMLLGFGVVGGFVRGRGRRGALAA